LNHPHRRRPRLAAARVIGAATSRSSAGVYAGAWAASGPIACPGSHWPTLAPRATMRRVGVGRVRTRCGFGRPRCTSASAHPAPPTTGVVGSRRCRRTRELRGESAFGSTLTVAHRGRRHHGLKGASDANARRRGGAQRAVRTRLRPLATMRRAARARAAWLAVSASSNAMRRFARPCSIRSAAARSPGLPAVGAWAFTCSSAVQARLKREARLRYSPARRERPVSRRHRSRRVG